MNERGTFKRRDFVKLTLAGSAGAAAATAACHTASRELAPLLIPEEQIPAGVAYWSRGLCRQCEAGCGVLVRRMQAIVPLTRQDQSYRQARLVAKKLEGNPDHPINQGGLCARGQAALEVLYHPQRLAAPAARAGDGAPLQPMSWDSALAGLRQQISAARPGEVAWLGRPLRATEAEQVAGFLSALGAHWWVYQALPAPRAEEDAARLERLGEADCLLSFANFLETWPGQAGATRAYARFRRQPQSYFLQAEPRLSLTATNADDWAALRPGSEGIFALAVAARWIELRSGADAVPGWLRVYANAAARRCGLPATQINSIARKLSRARRPLVLGGPNAYAYEHAGFQQEAIQFLARQADLAAGIELPASKPRASHHGAPIFASQAFTGPSTPPPRVLIVHDANPLFSAPAAWNLESWLRAIPYVVVLGTMPDETAAAAHMVLPLSTMLESWADDERSSARGELIATLNPPAMRPLHDTRSLLEILAALVPAPAAAAADTPAGSSELDAGLPAIRAHWRRLRRRYAPQQKFAAFWQAALAQGGFWTTPTATTSPAHPIAAAAGSRSTHRPPRSLAPPATSSPAWAKLPSATPVQDEFPYYLHLYESSLMSDGAGSWLTWLQELPDPTSSAMWCNWIELHPQLAARLGLRQGDGVWVESAAGKIELPVFLYPGLRPDTAAIPTGQGHTAGEAVTNRGANPFRLLSGRRDPETGALAWQANPVRLTPSGRRLTLPLFGHSLHARVHPR